LVHVEEGENEVQNAIARARAGDGSALWQRVDRLRPYLRAVAGNVLRDRLAGKVEVADVVQEALLAAVERFDQFQGTTGAELDAWIVAIVRNEARNLVRFWHQERRHVARENAPPESSEALPRVASDVSLPPTPSQRVASRQEASILMEALDRLPHEHREVLVLRQFDGLSHAAIAARLGKKEDAVRQLWVRALRALRETMGAA
jgi:RNA polymerase sigma-70 factor (subfamily 1)